MGCCFSNNQRVADVNQELKKRETKLSNDKRVEPKKQSRVEPDLNVNRRQIGKQVDNDRLQNKDLERKLEYDDDLKEKQRSKTKQIEEKLRLKQIEKEKEREIDFDELELEVEIDNWKNTVEELNKNTKLKNYALARKRTDFDNFDQVIDYLSKGPFRNDIEKAWLIYVWITDNIDYDGEAFKTGNYGKSDPESLLKSGKAVCGGYSGLYENICKRLNIECKYISGYSKAFGYKVGEKMVKEDHAWNAIKIGDEWFYIESTWGAGHVKKTYEFVKEFNPYYFMVPHRIFLQRHFNESFQLQKNKLTQSEFEKLQVNQLRFYLLGLKCLTYNTCIIQAQTNPIFIEYSSKQHLVFTTSLESQQTGKKIENKVLIQSEYDETTLSYRYGFIVYLPEKDHKYEFKLFGKAKSKDDENYKWLSEYLIIRCSENRLKAEEIRPYNILLGHNLHCLTHKCALIEAMTNPIFIEFTSDQHISFTTSLLSLETGIKSDNKVIVQTEYVKVSHSYKYGFIMYIPEKDHKYQFNLFGKSKNSNNQSENKFIYTWWVIRKKENILMASQIRPYEILIDNNISCLSHNCTLIEFNTNPLIMKFYQPESILTIFDLKDSNEVAVENSVLTQDDINDRNKLVKISVPVANRLFYLQIFAKNASDKSKSYAFVYSFYLYRTGSDFNDNMKFVYLYGINFKFYIFHPVNRSIESNKQQQYKYYIKDALKVALVDSGENWHHLNRSSNQDEYDIWTINQTITNLGDLTLYAQFDSNKSFSAVCKYNVR